MQKLKDYWETRSANERRGIVVALIVAGILLGGYLAVGGKADEARARRAEVAEKKDTDSLLLDSDTLERDLYDRLQAELESKSNELTESRKEMKQVAEDLKKALAMVENKKTPDPNNPASLMPNLQDGAVQIPPPPPPPQMSTTGQMVRTNAATGMPNGPQQNQAIEVIGGIGRVEGKEAETTVTAQKKTAIHLPPSFMEATLLSGLDAPIGGEAQKNPKPVMIRVAAPAILPNRVKANLKDCFVIAHGYGSLAEERVNLRLVSLNCVGKDNQAVIEQKVAGYVVDADGKVGLRGRVVMRAGRVLGLTFLAGVAEGAGRAVESSSTVTSTSGIGVTQSLNTDEIANAAIGGGIAQGSGELQRFYMDLAKETLPVIEVGPKKKVTLVIQEGVDLEIKYQCLEEADECVS